MAKCQPVLGSFDADSAKRAHLVPAMTVDADIVTGERTRGYRLSPISLAFGSALRDA